MNEDKQQISKEHIPKTRLPDVTNYTGANQWSRSSLFRICPVLFPYITGQDARTSECGLNVFLRRRSKCNGQLCPREERSPFSLYLYLSLFPFRVVFASEDRSKKKSSRVLPAGTRAARVACISTGRRVPLVPPHRLARVTWKLYDGIEIKSGVSVMATNNVGACHRTTIPAFSL